MTIAGALSLLKQMPFEDRGFAKIDHHRHLRRGIPEAIYAAGKTPAQVAELFVRQARAGLAIATRVSPAHVRAVKRRFPRARHFATARMLASSLTAPGALRGTVCVVAAGTSDLPVAEEAAVTASLLGNPVTRVTDVGVAGLHRLMAHRSSLLAARVVIVVAGMEGALPSVVGGIVAAPIVAVPTSVGYGASYGGLAALLAMLNSCAAGIGVVNIDNGFGAGCLAHLINGPR